jgi:hypothetical protein
VITLDQFTGIDDGGTSHDEPDLRVTGSDSGGTAAATVRGAAVDLDRWAVASADGGPDRANG